MVASCVADQGSVICGFAVILGNNWFLHFTIGSDNKFGKLLNIFLILDVYAKQLIELLTARTTHSQTKPLRGAVSQLH